MTPSVTAAPIAPAAALERPDDELPEVEAPLKPEYVSLAATQKSWEEPQVLHHWPTEVMPMDSIRSLNCP